MRYLEGINVKPSTNKQAKTLIGKKVQYLRDSDIDKSGRGYFFPRDNTISAVFGRQIIFDNCDSVYFNDIVEMVIVE